MFQTLTRWKRLRHRFPAGAPSILQLELHQLSFLLKDFELYFPATKDPAAKE